MHDNPSGITQSGGTIIFVTNLQAAVIDTIWCGLKGNRMKTAYVSTIYYSNRLRHTQLQLIAAYCLMAQTAFVPAVYRAHAAYWFKSNETLID